jgi:hypothetical protein
MDKKLLRALGVFLLADGLLTTIFGRRYVRLFRMGSLSSPYRRAIERMLDISS